MAESSGVNPVPLPLARYLPAAPARAADCKLFADSLAGADMGLAHRGQVNVSAGYAAQGWHITLGAQQAGTRHWLARQRQACQRRLARALGQPVSLQLMAQYL